MKSINFFSGLLSRLTLLALLGLSGCWQDDLGLQVSTPFEIDLSPVQPIALPGEAVSVRLGISPVQPLQNTRYEVSYQNTTALAVGVKLDGKVLARGQWEPLSELSGLLTLKCDTVGQPSVTVLVRDQTRQLQSATVAYTTTR